MKNPFAPVILDLNRNHRSNDPPLALNKEPAVETSCRQEQLRSFQTGRWQMAVGRLGACRNLAGDNAATIYRTSPRTPILYELGDESIFQKEISLHRRRLPQGIYRAVELEILCFISTVSLNNWEAANNKNVTVPMKIFVSNVPELGIRRGDLLFQVEGKDYWLSPDWKTLFRQRPEKPLSAILLPEGSQFVSPGKEPSYQMEMLPGERFQIRLALPGTIVAQRQKKLRRGGGSPPSYLQICR